MRNETGGTMVHVDLQNNPYSHRHRTKFSEILSSGHGIFSSGEDSSNYSNNDRRDSGASTMSGTPTSGEASPCALSPWAQVSPTSNRTPWTNSGSFNGDFFEANGLIGSIVREEGHIYSLAASGDLLYTGSDSKNIRVWKNLKDYAGFKSNSGLVKDIVIYGDRIFTGHQDGKVRVWKVSKKKPGKHVRVGSLPTFKAMMKSSVNPKHYIEARRNRNAVKARHFDAVSCLSLNEELGLLYSSSWDRTVKVWKISNSKCLESIDAHEDAINSVVAGFDDLVFTGSADGTVKVWKRELQGKGTKHFLVQILLKQENAVTAVAVNLTSAVIYCGSSDGLVNFWEREKHLSHGGTLRGHKSAVLCLATAGNMLMSGSADKNICVWRRNNDGGHACLSVLTGHMGPVKCLAVEEDRLRSEAADKKCSRRWIVYSGSLDKSVKVWRVSDHAPMWRELDAHASGSSGRRGG